MRDAPQAEVLVLLAAQARIAAERLTLPGGGSADVLTDDDGDQLVQVAGGRVRPDELVRTVVRSPGFSLRGDVLDLVVVTDAGWDRRVVGPALRTLLLVARRDDQQVAGGGRHVVVIGPPADDPLAAAGPSAAAGAVARLVGRGSRPVGQVTELPLVADPLLADAAGRRDAVLADADLVVAAWGVVDDAFELAVDDARASLRQHRERGGGVLVRTRAGQLDAVGADGHPAARDEARSDDGLAAAPADWLWGAPLA